MKVLTSTYATLCRRSGLYYNNPIWTQLPPPPANVKVFSDSIQFGNENPTSIPADVQAVVDAELLKAEQAGRSQRHRRGRRTEDGAGRPSTKAMARNLAATMADGMLPGPAARPDGAAGHCIIGRGAE